MATQTSGEKIGEIFVEIRTKFDKLDSDLKNMESRSVKSIKNMENSFAKASIRFNDNLLKKSLGEIEQSTIKLRAHLERKIKLGVPLGELEALQSSIDRSESALKKFHKEAEKPSNFENASRWGMIATGIQSATMAVRDFFTQMKQIIIGSAGAAAELNVLRASFKGNAEDLELFNKAVAGTISEGKIIALSNWATDLKMSMEDQAIAFSFAEDRADSYGGSIEENFNKIVNASEGMGRGLKEIGIETKVYQENLKNLTKEQGIKLENLDADAQKTIMLKAVIMSLGVTLEDIKNKQKDENDLIQAAGVSVDEARIKLGQFILGGLVPLLQKFDESGKSIKGFITGTIAIVGTILQAIPLVVQLYTAKKLFASATLISAAAVDKETTSIIANSAAQATNVGILTKVGAAFGTIGLSALGLGAVAAVVLSLAENIKSLDVKRLEDAVNLANQLQKDKNTGKSLGFQGIVNAPNSGKVDPNNLILSSILNNKGSGLISPHLWNSTAAEMEKVGMSAGEIIAKINALGIANTQANISLTEYQKNLREIDRLQKILSGTGYFDMFNKQKTELAEVNNLLKNKNIIDAQRNILLEKQKELAAQIYKYEHPDTAVNLLGLKGLPYKDSGKQEPLNMADYNLNKPDMMAYNEAAKKLHDDMLNAASEFGNALENAVDRAGDNFVKYINQALQAAIKIADILDKIDSGDKLPESGFLRIAATIISLFSGHSGGEFISTSAGVMKMAGGGSFIVPSGYPHDTFPLMVETGERVTVTPASQVGAQNFSDQAIVAKLDRVVNSIHALTKITLQNREVISNLYLDSKLLATSITNTQNDFERGNVKVNS